MARASGDEANLSSATLGDVGPDSSHLRISGDTKHESGIPPARARSARGQEQLEHTLSEIARTEANLQSLVRGLRHLTAGANAALESTSELASEFDVIRQMFAHDNANESDLRQTIAELSAALERARADAHAERHQLIEADDRFLVELLNDHERELRALEQRLTESPKKASDEAIAELTAQRDQARAYALQCELERDLAWQDLGVKTPAPRVNTPGLPAAEVRKKTPIGTLKLRAADPTPELGSDARATTRHSAEYSVVDVGAERVQETKRGLQSTR